MSFIEWILLVYCVGVVIWMGLLIKITVDNQDSIVESVEEETGQKVDRSGWLLFLSILLMALIWPFCMLSALFGTHKPQ